MFYQMSLYTKEWKKSGGSDQEKGQGLLEYSLIIIFIVIVIISAAALFGEEVRTLYITIVDRLSELL